MLGADVAAAQTLFLMQYTISEKPLRLFANFVSVTRLFFGAFWEKLGGSQFFLGLTWFFLRASEEFIASVALRMIKLKVRPVLILFLLRLPGRLRFYHRQLQSEVHHLRRLG